MSHCDDILKRSMILQLDECEVISIQKKITTVRITDSEKRSCFTDKLGDNISNEIFNLIDDPHSPDGIGSKPFDDEGTPTSSQFLIKSGVLMNLISDSFEAFKREKSNSTGNAARPGSPMGRSAHPLPVSLPS